MGTKRIRQSVETKCGDKVWRQGVSAKHPLKPTLNLALNRYTPPAYSSAAQSGEDIPVCARRQRMKRARNANEGATALTGGTVRFPCAYSWQTGMSAPQYHAPSLQPARDGLALCLRALVVRFAESLTLSGWMKRTD